MNPHEEHAAMQSALMGGFLRRIPTPPHFRIFGWDEDSRPGDDVTWDQAEEDREQGIGIRLDDPPRDSEEFAKRWPLPARESEGKYIPNGG